MLGRKNQEDPQAQGADINVRGGSAEWFARDPAGRVFCLCCGCQRWKEFIQGHSPQDTGCPQYEVITKDYISFLASYIHELAVGMIKNQIYAGPLRVLELGAGDGRLSHHLTLSLRQLQGRDELTDPSPIHGESVPMVEVYATDSGLRGLHKSSPVGKHVELTDYKTALELHQPHVVICCWQPMGTDWTKEIRATSSVQEYLLIGESVRTNCHIASSWM